MINFLAVIEGPQKWAAPAWMRPAKPGEHLAPFAGWHPAVTEMLSAVPQSPRWAHPGQGANQTIEDASVLAADLAACVDIPAAMRRYTQRRRAHTRPAWRRIRDSNS